MTTAPPQDEAARPARNASQTLIDAARSGTSEEMSIGELFEALEDRAFGMVMLLFALPCCIPFVYLIPQVVSVPMLVVAAQIVAGRHTPWLPEKMKARTFSRATFEKTALRAQRYLGWFERISSPRLTFLTRGVPERIFGAFMVVFCISILTPLPSTNTMPGIAVAIMSIGFIERDGLLVILGTILGTLWVTFLILFAGTLTTAFLSLFGG